MWAPFLIVLLGFLSSAPRPNTHVFWVSKACILDDLLLNTYMLVLFLSHFQWRTLHFFFSLLFYYRDSHSRAIFTIRLSRGPFSYIALVKLSSQRHHVFMLVGCPLRGTTLIAPLESTSSGTMLEFFNWICGLLL